MPVIQTVRGPIAPDVLGTTLAHEHVFVLSPEISQNFGHEYWDEEARVVDAITKLRQLKEVGVDSIVDPTIIGLGRYIPRLQRVNEQVDINIVPATGLYIFESVPHYFIYRGPGTIMDGPELMTEMFLSDIRIGIGGTDVKAAFLKCAVEAAGFTPDQVRVHNCIYEAHMETGVPIMVHTNAAHQTGRQALDFYAERGVDLTRIQIAHAGDSNDLDYLRWILDQGAYIGCDRFGLDVLNPTEQRISTIVSLCEQGYADRILLGHDADCYSELFSGEEWQARMSAAAPDWHYRFISEDVLPIMRERGVSDEQIHLMLVDNPRRFLVGA